MSASSFHQRFKAVTSMSPLQYQKALRLHEARRLMLFQKVDASRACHTRRLPESITIQQRVRPFLRQCADQGYRPATRRSIRARNCRRLRPPGSHRRLMTLVTPIIQRWIDEGRRDPDGLWERAANDLPWFRKWDRVFEPDPPTFRWFVGGQTNIGFNAVDRHVLDGHGGRAALIYFNERGERVVQTYAQLLHEVKRIAAALRGLGIGKGDRITIYMPPCPQSIALILATVRIGAIHSIVFAGFGAQALGDRIAASGSRARVCDRHHLSQGKGCAAAAHRGAGASGRRRIGRTRRRARSRRRLDAGGSHLRWDDFLQCGYGHDSGHEVMESNEPAFILATSGTTATPKLAIHTHGGYQVHVATMGKWCFGLRQTDVWWATSDIGWIVGHSYMVYGPLLAGCTTIVVRGRARLSARQHQLARRRRGVRRHRHLHVTDGGPHADALRQRTAARDRSFAPRAHRLCG